MKKIDLTPQTIEILKAFAQVNPNMLFQPGKTVSTIAEEGNIFAYATVAEEFTTKFGIYDLTSFLAILSSFEAPVLEFSEEKNSDDGSLFVTITEKDGKGSFKYFGSPEKVLKFVTKTFAMPPTVAEFDVKKDVLSRALRAGQTAQLPHFLIESDKKTIDLVVTDLENDASNRFRLPVSEESTADKFTTVFKMEHLKLMSGSYNIALDGKLVARFANADKNVQYFIAIDRSSTYGKLINE